MKRSESTSKQTIRFFWKYTSHYPFHFWLGFLNIFQSSINGVLTPLLLGFATAKLSNPSATSLSFSQILLLILVTSIVAVIINRISLGAINYYESSALGDMNDDIAQHILYESYDFHSKNFSGALINKATKLSASYVTFMDTMALDVMRNAVIVVVSITVIALYDLILAAIVASLAALGFGLTIYISRRSYRLQKKSAQLLSDQTAYLADMITNAQAVKAFAGEKFELRKFHTISKDYSNSLLKAWSKQLDGNSMRMGVMVSMFLSVLAYGIYGVQHGLLPAGIFIAALLYCVRITGAFWDLTGIVRNLERVFADSHEMVEIMNQPAMLVDIPSAKPLVVSDGGMSFDHVTFHYSDAHKDDAVLTDFNLRIQPGEKIGLVGRSGGGKTTITKLALRFMDIQEGTISIDGQDISKVRQSDLRRSISYVPQEPLLFHRTLQENIGYGAMDADKNAVEKAAKLSHADQFIKELPKGYQTLVGERGVKLSGGQRQRIAIARAMLKNAPILILDEATSALDSESEVLIQDALWKLMEDRTAIVIAHRLSTIQKMDRILVLDEGKIIEEGTHKELLEQNGTYAQLWAHQSGGFIEE